MSDIPEGKSNIIPYDPTSEVIEIDPNVNEVAAKEDNIIGAESKFLNELIKDVIYYSLKSAQAHQYIKMRFGRDISDNILRTRKWRINNDNEGHVWLSHFTKVGYVLKHKKLIELSERLVDASASEIFFEQMKPYITPQSSEREFLPHELRNDYKLMRLRADMRENMRLMKELMIESPIVAELRMHIDAEYKLKIKLFDEYGIDIEAEEAKKEVGSSDSKRDNDTTKGLDSKDRRQTEGHPEAVF